MEMQIRQLEEEMATLLRSHQDQVQRLSEVPGLGVDSAQQIIAEVGATAATFPSAGELSSWVGAARDESGDELEDSELRDQAMTPFLAGHETMALALTWTWYLLSQNPEVDEKLAAQLRAVLGGREPAPSDLPALPYLGQVLKAYLRLYPPAWGIGREALEDFEVSGYHLPAGTRVFTSQWVTHRDPRLFPEPDRFHPDRWRDDPVARGKMPRFASFPFGGGPRVCIGAGFAQMEAALVLAAIAQRFRMTLIPDHPIRLLPGVTLRPKSGIRVTPHRRR
jgi:cytochrome P450